jgi:transcriptional regulator with XRE-family HTH domain
MHSYLAEKHISLTRYAELVGVSQRTVEKWISGEISRPQPLHLIRLCQLHDVDPNFPEDLGFTPRFRQQALPAMRDLLGTAAEIVFGASLSRSVTEMLEAKPSRVLVGGADVSRITNRQRNIYMAGHLVGAGAFKAEQLLAEHTKALTLLRSRFASEAIRAQSHAAVASLGREIGWNLHDLGLQNEARRLWLAALAIARDAESSMATIVQAHTLENLAHQAIALGQAQHALDFLSMAEGREHLLPPVMRSMLSSVKAQATAGLGQVDQTRRHIAFAEEFLDAPSDERDAEWNVNGWYDRAEMNGNAAHALTTLAIRRESIVDEAITRATDSIQGYRPDEARSQARVKISLARLHAAHGDVDGTQLTAKAAVDAARHLRSSRVIGELVALRPLLKPMKNSDAVATIDRDIKELTTALPT